MGVRSEHRLVAQAARKGWHVPLEVREKAMKELESLLETLTGRARLQVVKTLLAVQQADLDEQRFEAERLDHTSKITIEYVDSPACIPSEPADALPLTVEEPNVPIKTSHS